MKTPDKTKKADSGKQKKQLLVLGGLAAVLVAVVAIQFGGAKPDYEVAALAEPASPEAAGAEPGPEAAPAPAPIAVKDNAVLAQPVAEAELKHSPFSNFWSGTTTEGGTTPSIAAPSITVNATMPSATLGMAVIDGQMHVEGESIQGWQLSEVRPRAVVLRSPTNETVVVQMPLLVGHVLPPSVIAAPAGASPDPAAEAAKAAPASAGG